MSTLPEKRASHDKRGGIVGETGRQRSTTKTTSKVLLSVLCRSFCILGLVHLGIQSIQHRLQQGQLKRRIVVPFMNEDFARSEEILNADPFTKKHIHRPFSVSGLAF